MSASTMAMVIAETSHVVPKTSASRLVMDLHEQKGGSQEEEMPQLRVRSGSKSARGQRRMTTDASASATTTDT
ncbi:MAG: hypothetical protein R3E12_07075 [Candidatus Eisenbacteria bacterium]